jgi:hypothetical protein
MRKSEQGIFGFHERLAIPAVVQHERPQFHSGPSIEYLKLQSIPKQGDTKDSLRLRRQYL